MRPGIKYCPFCHFPLTPAQMRKRINFDCPMCRSTLRCDFGTLDKYIRPTLILGVMIFYAWKHGWDHGFVLFLLGFYGCIGMIAYLFLVIPFLPFQLKLVAPPISKTYLNAKPLAENEYEAQSHSMHPLKIT